MCIRDSSWRAWIAEAENRYRVLSIWCRQVHVLGLSFGASIALQLNVRPRPRSLVLLAPALHPRVGLLGRLALGLGLHRRPFFRKRLGWKSEVLDGMEAAREADWWKGVPVYAAMCEDDHRIDLSSLNHLRRRSSNEKTRIRTFPAGGHVFVETEPKDELRKEILDFLREN